MRLYSHKLTLLALFAAIITVGIYATVNYSIPL